MTDDTLDRIAEDIDGIQLTINRLLQLYIADCEYVIEDLEDIKNELIRTQRELLRTSK